MRSKEYSDRLQTVVERVQRFSKRKETRLLRLEDSQNISKKFINQRIIQNLLEDALTPQEEFSLLLQPGKRQWKSYYRLPGRLWAKYSSSEIYSGNIFIPPTRRWSENMAVLRNIRPEYGSFSPKRIQFLHERSSGHSPAAGVKNLMPASSKSTLIWDCVWIFRQGSLKCPLARLPTHQLCLSHLSLLNHLDNMRFWSFSVLIIQPSPSFNPRDTSWPPLCLECRAVWSRTCSQTATKLELRRSTLVHD